MNLKIPDNLVLAYSGGSDSSFALHFLSQARRRQIRCVHINHGTALSQTFEDHCKKTCERLNIKLDIHRIKGSNEAEWHRMRYKIFNSYNIPVITAHNRNDNAENVIMFGHKIMPEYNNIIRPFLNFDKKFINKYLKYHNITWVCDPTNHDTSFTLRNKVRKHLNDLLASGCPLFKVLDV